MGSAGKIHSQILLNTVHFDLGKTKEIKKIRVHWRNGETSVLEAVRIIRLYDLPR